MDFSLLSFVLPSLKGIFPKISEILEGIKVSPVTKREQIFSLTEAYKSEKLVLVLGAGVSMEHGLPSWNMLLQKLLISTLSSETNQAREKSAELAKYLTEIFSPNPLIATRYIKKHYKKHRTEGTFEEAVRDAIYEEIDLKNEIELFKEIRQLCVAPGKSANLDCIITYNYDNILETYLSKLDIEVPYKSIYSVSIKPKVGELPIYHVHGFLPQKGTLTDENEITLSEDIYHQQYNDIYSWRNMVQINKFRDNICLFIGTSFTDPNLRRLLDIAMMQRGNSNDYHYIIRKKYDLKIVESFLSKNIIKRLYLFCWDEIPENNYGQLVEFLSKKFELEWIKKAKIEKIDDGKKIRISNEEKSLLLKLNDDKTKVNLQIDDSRTDEFDAIIENGVLNIYIKLSDEEKLELEKNVKTLTETMERIEENDALSFKVNTIWIQNYNEIPQILKNIRKGQYDSQTEIPEFTELKRKISGINQLQPQINQLEENVGKLPEDTKLSSDYGYSSSKNHIERNLKKKVSRKKSKANLGRK